jgi:hypothetical protein
MDEKLIKEEQDQPVAKKAYTPPALTVYGKLSELTAGGTGPPEGKGGGKDMSP